MILALDPAEKTGFASDINSGVFNCKLRSNESKGMKMIKFRAHVQDLITACDIKIVVYEKPGGRNFVGIRSHANFEGILIGLCEDLKVEYKDYSATEIKRYAKSEYERLIGLPFKKGQMNKADMIEAAISIYERDFVDDNHVDAYFLHQLAKKELTPKT